jgi:molybdopterin converting factor subunit 1
MNILYFAWVRSRIGLERETVEPPAEVSTVGALRVWLAGRSEGHAAALSDAGPIRAAVNHEYARDDQPVGPGDEVAFFPMVSGG